MKDFDSLPNEITSLIAWQLPGPCLVNFARVSRKCYELAIPALYHSVTDRDAERGAAATMVGGSGMRPVSRIFDFRSFLHTLATSQRLRSLVKSADLSPSDKVEDETDRRMVQAEAFALLCLTCTSLQGLHWCQHQGNLGLPRMDALKTLSLHFTHVWEKNLQPHKPKRLENFITMPSVQHLTLQAVAFPNNGGLESLAIKFPNVLSLVLSYEDSEDLPYNTDAFAKIRLADILMPLKASLEKLEITIFELDQLPSRLQGGFEDYHAMRKLCLPAEWLLSASSQIGKRSEMGKGPRPSSSTSLHELHKALPPALEFLEVQVLISDWYDSDDEIGDTKTAFLLESVRDIIRQRSPKAGGELKHVAIWDDNGVWEPEVLASGIMTLCNRIRQDSAGEGVTFHTGKGCPDYWPTKGSPRAVTPRNSDSPG